MLVNVQTKFNIGDTAYKFNPATMKLEPVEISRVNIHVLKNKDLSVSYGATDIVGVFFEKELFASKEEFIAQL